MGRRRGLPPLRLGAHSSLTVDAYGALYGHAWTSQCKLTRTHSLSFNFCCSTSLMIDYLLTAGRFNKRL